MIVRPLLELERSDILRCCDAMRLDYAEDRSNHDVRFFRNRIRHQLLPLLEAQCDPRLRENLIKLSASASSLLALARKKTQAILAERFREISPGLWHLDTAPLGELEDDELVILFGDFFAERLSLDMDFTRTHYRGLTRFVRDRGFTGKQLSLPGLTVRKEHGGLLFRVRPPRAPLSGRMRGQGGETRDKRAAPTFLEIPGQTVISNHEGAALWIVTAEVLSREKASDVASRAHSCDIYLDRGVLGGRLEARHPRPGDRMQPFGMRGRKKLSDIFIDRKIPWSERASTLVIADDRGILWLVGVTRSEHSRVDGRARSILRLHVENAQHSAEREQDGKRHEQNPPEETPWRSCKKERT